MRDFQGIVFIWTQIYREIFKSALVYLQLKASRLESDLTITKNANKLLSSRLVEVKKQCWADSQYFRRETLEVVRLMKSLSNNEEESKICDIFGKLACNIAKDDKWENDSEQGFRVKNDLSKLNVAEVDLSILFLYSKELQKKMEEKNHHFRNCLHSVRVLAFFNQSIFLIT